MSNEDLSTEEWRQIALFFRNKVNELELQVLAREVIQQREVEESPSQLEEEIE